MGAAKQTFLANTTFLNKASWKYISNLHTECVMNALIFYQPQNKYATAYMDDANILYNVP